MGSRKQIPQPRLCAQCGTTFYSARKGHVHCSGACNTRAWRARQLSTPRVTPVVDRRAETSTLRAPADPLLPPDSARAPAADAAGSSTTQPLGFGKTVAATVVGNAISSKLGKWLGPKEASTSLPLSGWPTWPPAELLATTGPSLLLREPDWVALLLLTPVTYRQHILYLCLDQGLTVVLYQQATGEWQRGYTPAQLAQLTRSKQAIVGRSTYWFLQYPTISCLLLPYWRPSPIPLSSHVATGEGVSEGVPFGYPLLGALYEPQRVVAST